MANRELQRTLPSSHCRSAGLNGYPMLFSFLEGEVNPRTRASPAVYRPKTCSLSSGPPEEILSRPAAECIRSLAHDTIGNGNRAHITANLRWHTFQYQGMYEHMPS